MTNWEALIPQIVHDIRAFVRKGLTSAQLLERTLTGVTPDTAKYLRASIEAQTDLNRFLARLMALADARRRPSSTFPEEIVALEIAVLGAKIECKTAIDAAGAELVLDQISDSRVPQRTQIVIREIFDNSLRFSHPARKPRVIFESSSTDEFVHFRISDNGAGVPGQYATKLFQPLQRLDSRGEFGLGLAISQAIVSDLGGQIKHEPLPAGSAFSVQLPHVH